MEKSGSDIFVEPPAGEVTALLKSCRQYFIGTEILHEENRA
jgi:ABC-type cobalt transport system substrate-binding protein